MGLERLMDLIREFQYDYFVDEWSESLYSPVEGGCKMHLVDTIVCVVCGQREYSLSKGKSSRVHNGVCAGCKPILKDEVPNGVPTKDGTKGKP